MAIETDTKIGVFFGSRSPEHDVSIVTAGLVIAGLKNLGYTTVPIYISKEGRWYISEELGNIDFFKDPNYEKKLGSLPTYSLSTDKMGKEMVFKEEGIFSKKEISINVAFPAMHGVYGEDGTIQGLFEMFGIPYVGCDVATSAIAMDKVLTKIFYEHYDIPTTEFISFTEEEWGEYKEDILSQIKNIGLPVFIKPARTGSSIGITNAKNKEELEMGIEVAFHYDQKVLVERAVENLADLTVCVMGNGNPEASLIQESRFNKDFFSYTDKYIEDGGAQTGRATKNIIIPAEIDEESTKRIRNMARDIFVMFECSGIARVDFLMNRETGKVYANEINTLPGTLYHHLWRESGVSTAQLLKNLTRFAKERNKKRGRITRTFQSDILKNIGDGKLSQKLDTSTD
ncbi:MAG: D-alanine--D-alanine ligase family protein [Candidatus Paceibacterota bacterium]